MVTFGIAILLAAGLAASKITQRFHLPSVTGYILAGLLLGPTGFGIITQQSIGHNLTHFTQIALMLIAFGIGEHIELNTLKKHTKSLKWIGLFEALGAFLVVSTVIFVSIKLINFIVPGWTLRDYMVLCLLLGSIGVATAPAATLLVIRELRAKGPLTSTLMAIVAIDDGLAIMIFGLVVSIAHQVLGHSGAPILISIGASLMEIIGSLLLGILTGATLILLLSKLEEQGELMTGGLAILLLCGEIALYLHLSPLLAGMAAGFSLVNKAERDVRVFRALNKFEPPIYVLFFTLAGSHLDIESLQTAGVLGIIYFISTVTGKISGIHLGARIAGSPLQVRRYLGLAMMPQAGVAIGLIFLLSSDKILAPYAIVITPVVLTGVFLSELVGPISARYALAKAGEITVTQPATSHSPADEQNETGEALCSLHETFRIIPWKWEQLAPPETPHGFVVFHAIDPLTARGLARTATVLASYYEALPMAIHITPSTSETQDNLFREEQAEVNSMGYTLVTEIVPGPDISAGLIAAVAYNDARAVVLAQPLKGETDSFRALLQTVADNVHCPIAVARFYGELHTERILIPLTDIDALPDMYEIIAALNSIGEHKLSLLYMMPSEAGAKEIISGEHQIEEWLQQQGELHGFQHNVTIMAIPTDSRLDMIEEAAREADIVVIGAQETSGVGRILFGSLVDSVAANLRKTLIIVYNAGKHTKRKSRSFSPENSVKKPLPHSHQEEQP
jgi:Kef-type K+ transport system membrane component KefB/nucleotide-binding universal stress UspA family protein